MNSGHHVFESVDSLKIVIKGKIRVKTAYDMKLGYAEIACRPGCIKHLVYCHGISILDVSEAQNLHRDNRY
jgi:hypothetical protein